MRRIIFLFIGLVTIGFAGSTIYFWPKIERALTSMFEVKDEAKDYEEAKKDLEKSDTEAALKIIKKYEPDLTLKTESGKKWVTLYIKAVEQAKDIGQLLRLHNQFPSEFSDKEEASLLIGAGYLATGNGRGYESLRNLWRNRETKKDEWFNLDADKLLLDGKRNESVEFLKSQSFEGSADSGRLIRLALLVVYDNPKQSWDYLTEAYSKDPKNPAIRSYRARLLEAVGKNPLALYEYIAAVQTDPKNSFLRDQLAEFYRRHNQYALALQVWGESLTDATSDLIWLKTLFWSKVTFPLKFDWSAHTPPEGALKPLVEYLITLKPDQFWNDSTFGRVSDSKQFLTNNQVTYWLRILEDLKEGNEKNALDLLSLNTFKSVSWSPELENALKQILNYRLNGVLKGDDTSSIADSAQTNQSSVGELSTLPAQDPNMTEKVQHPFFDELNNLAKEMSADSTKKIPENLSVFLENKDVFAAALLAVGWSEAALQLNDLSIIPDNFPDWVAYGFTQAYRFNRGNLEALEFATRQKETPSLSLLIGELLIATGSLDAGLDKLLKLSKDDTDIGYRASWLVSLIYIDQKEYLKAKEAILAQPRLAKDVLGQETLARIALLEGNVEEGEKIYLAIGDQSSEAKSYFARKAFADKDWKKARAYTEDLLREFPTNLVLNENYKKILEEEAKEKGQNSAPSIPGTSPAPSKTSEKEPDASVSQEPEEKK